MRQIQKMYSVESFTLSIDGYTLLLRFLATKVKKEIQYSATFIASIFYFIFLNYSVHKIKTSHLLQKSTATKKKIYSKIYYKGNAK